MKKHIVADRFIILGFSCLLLSITFGLIASLQYIFPQLLINRLSFQQTRPLHVFLAVNWIFACVTGLIYRFIPLVAERELYSTKLAKIHFGLALATIAIAVTGFCTGHFSGREYLEFPPWVTAIIITYWLLFSINFLKTIQPLQLKHRPVYIWSWSAGLLFFLITIIEAHLWLLPYFSHNIVRDITVQWKANGSMVGAWNMLIYGSSMFAMERISGKKDIGYQKTSFAFYFLGLTNLMFNWGHHTYVVPANPWIREVSYFISMTELILFANIIMKWKKGLLKDASSKYFLTTRFFKTADRWILLNLAVGIALSIPSINKYTHGTQITVAHAMGATIGINTMLLLGSVAYSFEARLTSFARKIVNAGLFIMNVSLFFFWSSLLLAGITRAIEIQRNSYFASISLKLQPFLRGFSIAGIFLVVGTCIVVINLLKAILSDQDVKSKKTSKSKAINL